MADNRSVKSRKRDANSRTVINNRQAAKSSLINKVNAEDKKRKTKKPSELAKTSLIDKVNAPDEKKKSEVKKPEKKVEAKKPEKVAVEATKLTNDKKDSNKQTKKADNKKPEKNKKQKESKAKTRFGNSFFFRLSKVGRVMLVIYVVGIIVFGFLFARAMMNKGHVILGSRDVPAMVISNDDVAKVKTAVEQAVPNADSIDVQYVAYRLVIVADLADSSNKNDGKKANIAIYNAVNKTLPVAKYFSSKDKLSNDLYIYSSDVVPTNYETNSKYIYQTYKNSKMSKTVSYDLLTPRDKKSAQEVLETMDKAGN